MLNAIARVHRTVLEYNYTYRSPYTVILLFLLAVLATALPGCSTSPLSDPSSTQTVALKIAVQTASIRLIRKNTTTADQATARAAKVKEVAEGAQRWLDNPEVPAVSLPDLLRSRIAELNLPPDEQLLANALVAVVEQEITGLTNAASPTLPPPPEQLRTTVNTLLDWVIEAAEAYGV